MDTSLRLIATIALIAIVVFGWRFVASIRRYPFYWKRRALRLTAQAPRMELVRLKSDIAHILEHLDNKRLQLSSAKNYTDKADVYWSLGELQTNMMQFIDAEKCFRSAIDVYNEALKIDPKYSDAIAHKFKVVESLDQLQRSRF